MLLQNDYFEKMKKIENPETEWQNGNNKSQNDSCKNTSGELSVSGFWGYGERIEESQQSEDDRINCLATATHNFNQ